MPDHVIDPDAIEAWWEFFSEAGIAVADVLGPEPVAGAPRVRNVFELPAMPEHLESTEDINARLSLLEACGIEVVTAAPRAAEQGAR